ncbi:glycosyltransferase family 25 protein [Polycladidibacter stylochi]|uniref:glycosyltransferase family 25 protein n=1 Tax=Polycladidibacter stylochi TaxID=1807766 RepID=UPI00083390D7|nr:glycosyltransferase family 25 protein [Pseudovibrio stylochi]
MIIKYFTINLDNAVERRKHMQLQATKWGLDIHFFSAVTPDTMAGVRHEYDAKRTRYHIGRGLAPTELACGLSHLELWRQLEKDEEADAYVIFEDDVLIEADLNCLLKKIKLDRIQLLKLANTWCCKGYEVRDLVQEFKLLRLFKTSEGATAYLLHKKECKQIIEFCQNFRKPIDTLIDDYSLFKIKAFSIYPYPVKVIHNADLDTPFSSSLEHDRHTFKSAPMSKMNRFAYRALRRKWRLHKQFLYMLFRLRCFVFRRSWLKYPGVLS